MFLLENFARIFVKVTAKRKKADAFPGEMKF